VSSDLVGDRLDAAVEIPSAISYDGRASVREMSRRDLRRSRALSKVLAMTMQMPKTQVHAIAAALGGRPIAGSCTKESLAGRYAS